MYFPALFPLFLSFGLAAASPIPQWTGKKIAMVAGVGALGVGAAAGAGVLGYQLYQQSKTNTNMNEINEMNKAVASNDAMPTDIFAAISANPTLAAKIAQTPAFAQLSQMQAAPIQVPQFQNPIMGATGMTSGTGMSNNWGGQQIGGFNAGGANMAW